MVMYEDGSTSDGASGFQGYKPPSPEDIKATYGFVALLAKQVPEIGALMQQAITEKWTSERFQMAVANTAWWKSTPSELRSWITQNVADPASAARALQTGGEQINNLAQSLGYNGFSQARANELWIQAKLAGYDEDQTKEWVFNQAYQAFGPTMAGEFGQRVQEAKSLAMAYGYNPTDLDKQVNAWMFSAQRSQQDRATGLAGWTDKLKSYAKSKYSPFADRIDAGETVMDIAQPYIEEYSRVLEVNPQDVGLDDKLVTKWLTGTQAEAGKPPVSVPVWQAQQDLRKDTRWGYTNNGRQAAAEAATVIGKAFGMIGT